MNEVKKFLQKIYFTNKYMYVYKHEGTCVFCTNVYKYRKPYSIADIIL